MERKRNLSEGSKQVPLDRIIKRLEQRRQLGHHGEDSPGLTDARQPEQPRSGPGGSSYCHGDVRTSLYGEGNVGYWVFEPTNPSPSSAPLIVFLHGWGGGSPSRFGAWIHHLVRRGNMVLFPVYQGSLRPWAKPWEQLPTGSMLDNVIAAVRDAVKGLQTGTHVRPDPDRYAILGHSLGGTLAAQLAAVAERESLPLPKAIMPVAPGRGLWSPSPLPRSALHTIHSSVLMLVVVAEQDRNVGDHEGNVIFMQTPQIPPENKNLVVLVSDNHGNPPLVANHSSHTAFHPAYHMGALLREEEKYPPPNSMHYYGYWKIFDGLADAAFYQRNREFALGNTPQQRFMGIWSDGVPVRELRVFTDPKMLPRYRERSPRLKRWMARGFRRDRFRD